MSGITVNLKEISLAGSRANNYDFSYTDGDLTTTANINRLEIALKSGSFRNRSESL